MSRRAKSLPWLLVCWTLSWPILCSFAYLYLLQGTLDSLLPQEQFSSLFRHQAPTFAPSRRLGVGEEVRHAKDKLWSFTIWFKNILASPIDEIFCSSLLSFPVQSVWTLANLSGKNQSLNNATCFKTFLIRLWILLILLLVMVRLFCTNWRNNRTSINLLDLRPERVQANLT